MIKNRKIRIASLLIAVFIFVSCFTSVSYAVTDQDMAQISVTSSNKNPIKNETVTITVGIDNYKTMSPRISAMFISVSFDTSCFDYIPDSEKVTVKKNSSDLTSIAYDGIDKVSFAYTYGGSTLPSSANELFSFKLRAKDTGKDKTEAVFTVNDLTLYNGKNSEKYTLIECKDPKIDAVTVWLSRPALLINDSDKNKGTYTENVTITFDAASAGLMYEGRETTTIKSPYVCDKNGSYTVSVNIGGKYVTKSFVIDKEISNISVKPYTLNTEYPVGIEPDYSSGRLLVTYTDGTYSEISMDDEDIEITGFDAEKIGEQKITIKYKDKTTSAAIRVSAKKVISFTVTPPEKVEYLVGEDIDTAGGVLTITYDDGTTDRISITRNMLSNYDTTYVAAPQNVLVSYASSSDTFTVTYYPREAVDSLIMEIDALDLNTIDETSGPLLEGLTQKYNALTALEKGSVSNVDKLISARDIYESYYSGGATQTPSTDAGSKDGDDTASNNRTGPGNIIWYIVAGIIILAVIGGIAYFIFIYFKRKKEITDDEYYDDRDFEDESDDDDDGDLSYEDDVLNMEEDEDLSEDDDFAATINESIEKEKLANKDYAEKIQIDDEEDK